MASTDLRDENIAPIHVLSDDVLLLIFETILQPLSSEAASPPPWRISFVCHRWRALVLATPSLWTTVTFQPEINEDDRYPIEALEVQLVRAGSCPLNVMIDFSWLDGHAPKILEDQFRMLSADIERWHSLKLRDRLPLNWTLQTERHSPSSPSPVFSSLRKLHVDKDSWIRDGFLRNTPVLADLTLVDIVIQPSDPLCWHKLQRIELNRCRGSASDILTLLQAAASSLRVFKLILFTPSQQPAKDPDTFPVVELPELREVYTTGSSLQWRPPTSTLFTVATHLRLPRLQLLHLKRVDRNDLRQLHQLISKFPPGSSLTQFILEEAELKDTDVEELIRALAEWQSLESFSFGNSNSATSVTTTLLEALSWPGRGICPGLKKLSFTSLELGARALEAVVRSRVRDDGELENGPARLRAVNLEDNVLTEGEGDLQWLQDMGEQGVVEVSNPRLWHRRAIGLSCSRQPVVPIPTKPGRSARPLASIWSMLW